MALAGSIRQVPGKVIEGGWTAENAMDVPPGWDGPDDLAHYTGTAVAKKVMLDYVYANGLQDVAGDWDLKHMIALMRISRVEGLTPGDVEGPLSQASATKRKIFAQIAYIPHLIDGNAPDAIRRYKGLMTFRARMGKTPNLDELTQELEYTRSERERLTEQGASKKTIAIDQGVAEYYKNWRPWNYKMPYPGSKSDIASTVSEEVPPPAMVDPAAAIPSHVAATATTTTRQDTDPRDDRTVSRDERSSAGSKGGGQQSASPAEVGRSSGSGGSGQTSGAQNKGKGSGWSWNPNQEWSTSGGGGRGSQASGSGSSWQQGSWKGSRSSQDRERSPHVDWAAYQAERSARPYVYRQGETRPTEEGGWRQTQQSFYPSTGHSDANRDDNAWESQGWDAWQTQKRGRWS